MIIGFMRSPRWKTPVMSFIDEYCTVFDDEDENKLEFTKIHLVSQSLSLLTLLLAGFQEISRGPSAGVDDRVGCKRHSVYRGVPEGARELDSQENC
jgi:hypothetical protein